MSPRRGGALAPLLFLSAIYGATTSCVHTTLLGSAACQSDGDCAAMAGTVCTVGACLPGCSPVICPPPMRCTPSGQCHPPPSRCDAGCDAAAPLVDASLPDRASGCSRDSDCDPASSCTRAGTCSPLPFGSPTTCKGGTVVSDACNRLRAVADWRACVDAPGPAGCPYCNDNSCFLPGICASDADCHRGDACNAGLCRPLMPECPTTVDAALVVQGKFASGHEVCVRDVVTSSVDDADKDVIIRLGVADLNAVLTPQYQGGGLLPPAAGITATFHGVVRWDQSYMRWELYPVDWWQ